MATQTVPLPGYETTFITKAELSDDGLKQLNERIAGLITNFGGGVTVLNEDWGKRKLAYPINNETRGHYTYVVYTGKGDIVHEIERNLRLHEHVLRFLSVNLEKEFDADVFTKRRAEIHAAAKRREEEREARREERMAERRGYGGYGGDDDDRGGYRRDRGDRDRGEGRPEPRAEGGETGGSSGSGSGGSEP